MINRRTVLRSGISFGLCLGCPGIRGTVSAGVTYQGLESDRFLGPVKTLATVLDRKVFLEGPAVGPDGNVLFTNVPASKILGFRPATGQTFVFRKNTQETNGLFFAPDGRLLACEGGAARITAVNIVSGDVDVLCDQYEGKRLAKPNDLCIDRQGRIYFTSRSAVTDPKNENPKGVYRIDPNGNVRRILTYPDIHMPNGIVTSPDDSRLYVIDAHPVADRFRNIRVFDLDRHGDISGGKVLIDFYPGRSGDGMCIDAEGNLYVAAGLHSTRGTSETLATRPGIHVISPEGQLLAFRETPVDTVTNCTFGGADLRTLYAVCGNLLVSMQTKIPGKSSYAISSADNESP